MMMKWITTGLLLAMTLSGAVRADAGYYRTNCLYSAPAVGSPGSTAIHASSNMFTAWADGYVDVVYGEAVADEWKTPDNALGPVGGSESNVVVLGRGGRMTMTFSGGIGDRPGADFAVFENGYDKYFLELAYVEVSSDGIHFVRFPNYSDTPAPVGAFGIMFTEYIWGLASKYEKYYGTPFDLAELRTAYSAAVAGNTDFSPAFTSGLTNNFPLLDLDNITHVRLVDVVGDGRAEDAGGAVIYDPYPTAISAGFDLSGIGVIHPAGTPVPQHIFVEPLPNQVQGSHPVQVNAYASSGLPVLMEVYSGPAAVGIGPTNHLLELGRETGNVVLRACQPGDAITAPAAEVFIDFEIVEAGANNAPIPLADWLVSNSVPELAMAVTANASNQSAVVFDFTVDRRVSAYSRMLESAALNTWSNAIPEILEIQGDQDSIHMTVQVPADETQRFYRLILETL